jgi:hypothetical protein
MRAAIGKYEGYMGNIFSRRTKVVGQEAEQLVFDDQVFFHGQRIDPNQGARMNAALATGKLKSRPGFEPAQGAFEFAQHNIASAAEEVDETTHGAVPAAAAAVFEPGHRSPPSRRANFVRHAPYDPESEKLEKKSNGEQEPEIEHSDHEDVPGHLRQSTIGAHSPHNSRAGRTGSLL